MRTSSKIGIYTLILYLLAIAFVGCFTGKVSVKSSQSNEPNFTANAGVDSLCVFRVKKWPYESTLPNVAAMWGITACGKRTDSIAYGSVPSGYEQAKEPQPLLGGKLYVAEMHLNRGYPLLIYHIWFYVDEKSPGESIITTLTPVTSPLEWQKGDRAFKEIDLILDEVTGEILKIVPTEPTQ